MYRRLVQSNISCLQTIRGSIFYEPEDDPLQPALIP